MEQTKIEKIQDNLDELMEDNFIDEDLQKKIRSLVVDYVIEARKEEKEILFSKFEKINPLEYTSEDLLGTILEELRLRLLSSN